VPGGDGENRRGSAGEFGRGRWTYRTFFTVSGSPLSYLSGTLNSGIGNGIFAKGGIRLFPNQGWDREDSSP